MTKTEQIRKFLEMRGEEISVLEINWLEEYAALLAPKAGEQQAVAVVALKFGCDPQYTDSYIITWLKLPHDGMKVYATAPAAPQGDSAKLVKDLRKLADEVLDYRMYGAAHHWMIPAQRLLRQAANWIEQHARVMPVEAWQPIETAPKDKTAILVYAPQYLDGEIHSRWNGIFVARWDEATNAGAYGHKWRLCEYQNLGTNVSGNPTHWQPLPRAPVDAQGEGDKS